MKRTHIFICSLLAALIACQSAPAVTETATSVLNTPPLVATYQEPTQEPVREGEMLTGSWDRETNVFDGKEPAPSGLLAVDWKDGSGTVKFLQSWENPQAVIYDCQLKILPAALSKSFIVTASYRYQVVETMNTGARLLLADVTDYDGGLTVLPMVVSASAEIVTVMIGVDKPDNFDAIHYQFTLTSMYCSTYNEGQETILR